MRIAWWKVLCILLLLYTVVAGFLMPVPVLDRGNLEQTIRNLYFHVPMWFGMMGLYTGSFLYALRYLRSTKPEADIRSVEFAKIGTLLGMLGMLTGAEWATYTWGEPWSNDPKQLGAALSMLTYFAYFILRGGVKDEEKRARISAVYNIFAFAMMVPLLFVLPRMVDSLHPGSGGNPGFNAYDLDNHMRMVFYPAIVGWFLLGLWLTDLKVRIRLIQLFRLEHVPLPPNAIFKA